MRGIPESIVSNFNPDTIVEYWAKLSTKEESINLFGYRIPSMYAVNQNEMLHKAKAVQCVLSP